MAFSQAGITDVLVMADGPDLFVAWSSSLPAGLTFQVYVDRRLAWSGTARRCHVPTPAGDSGRNIWVEIGAVGPNEPTVDYSASLLAPGGRTERAQLSWSGGTYLDPTGGDDIQGFQIYQGSAPGSAVVASAPVATVAAYPGGWINDGFGKGGFGGAGFGRASTLYTWRSGPLASGVWAFAVVPFDKAGNARGPGQTASVTINAAPLPPAVNPGGSALSAVFSGPPAGAIRAQLASQPFGPKVNPLSTTYTANTGLQKPATTDRDWDIPLNANVDALDGMTALGALAVTTTETPSASLQIRVAAGNYVQSDGTVASFPGMAALAVAPSSTIYLWLNPAGLIASGSAFPASAHVRLAHVVAGPTSVTRVVDERVQCSAAGSGLGFVLKAGDTLSGPLTIAAPLTGNPVLVADPVGRLLGFFGAPPASQAPSLTPLASSSSGVAGDTLVDVGASFSQAALNNNFASLAAKVDALIAASRRHGLMSP